MADPRRRSTAPPSGGSAYAGSGGAFFWEFSGDTANGELVTAMDNGLN
nr:hypothetical protein [Streptomyces sp. FT05W]